jgi:hypothetical protein
MVILSNVNGIQIVATIVGMVTNGNHSNLVARLSHSFLHVTSMYAFSDDLKLVHLRADIVPPSEIRGKFRTAVRLDAYTRKMHVLGVSMKSKN